ncbi:kinase-like domain-containing protein [Aspergillus unguis]
MSAARQLLEALESLHSAGIVRRDLNERNCMWGIKPLGHLTRNSKKQGELVSPVKIPEDLRTEKFYLGDFGLAKKLGDSATESGIPPMQFCSPERLHKKEPSFACDIWSYMIIFSMLYLRFPPFPTFMKGGVISAIVRTLGPLPKQWQGSYADSMDYWYDQSQEPDPKYDLASIIANFRPDADPVERQHVLAIMAKVFTYDPEKRPTATELLRDPSFRAIVDRYEG